VTSLDTLLEEVHYLAFHYHWSEKDILSMTRSKRRRYLAILAGKLDNLKNQDSSS
jgi:hypothetical protein